MPDSREPKEPKERVKIVDRRSFTSDGERRSPDVETPPAGAAPPPHETVRGEGFEVHRDRARAPEGPLGAVPFSSFIVSLASTAFIHLGEIEDPVTRSRQVSLEGARQMIDIIDMLREKTLGNLDPSEQELIEGVLFELKLKYTQKAPAGGS